MMGIPPNLQIYFCLAARFLDSKLSDIEKAHNKSNDSPKLRTTVFNE